MPRDRDKDKDRDKPLSAGERRRDAAHERFERERAKFLLRVRHRALKFAIAFGKVNADQIQGLAEVPKGVSPKIFGAVTRPFIARSRAILKQVGDPFPSKREQAHGRKIWNYQLVNPAAAAAWMANNPLPRKGAK